MNTLKGLSLTALLIAGSMSFIPATQATTEAPTQALSTTVEAPLTDLTYDSPTITTSPAPAPVEAPAPAPTEALIEAPVEALIEAPLTAPVEATVEAPAEVVEEQPTAAPEQPTAAPTQAEDWNTSGVPLEIWQGAHGTDPQTTVYCPAVPSITEDLGCIDPYSGNTFVDCAAQGMLTAEDYTCAHNDYYTPNPEIGLDQWLENKCDTGNYASAGIARFCEYLAVGRALETAS